MADDKGCYCGLGSGLETFPDNGILYASAFR